MADQVKLRPGTKREVALYAALTGKTQQDLLDVAWAEYRERHSGELSENLRWAQEVLANSAEASIEASGMSDDDLDELRGAFEH